MNITSPLGEVVRDGEGFRLEFVRTYDEPIDDVWSALTDPDRVARWFGRWSGDPASGTVQIVMTAEEDDEPQTVQIVECSPPRRLEVVMQSADGPWPLTVELTHDGTRTTMVFVHRLAEPYDATGVGPGWHYYADRLDGEVGGTPSERAWDDYVPSLSESYGLPD